MDRRAFLRKNAGAAAATLATTAALGPPAKSPIVAGERPLPGGASAGSGTPIAAAPSGLSVAARPDPWVSPVLARYTAADHRRRLENIALCRGAIRACMRRQLITQYLPAQACYNLGEYPSRDYWAPGEYDEQELDRLRDHGIQLIQVFDDWNDAMGLFGGHKLTALNAKGFRKFVDMVHRRDMKVIAYLSSGFLQWNDKRREPTWSRTGDRLEVGYWDMARCSPASPGWRGYLLPHVVRILDDYGLDGLYNDCGYVTNSRGRAKFPKTPDEVDAFEETPQFDGAFADLLQLIYAEVKRRGGIVKLHVDALYRPEVGEAKVYDYLWVGEGVADGDVLRETTKNHPPYVVPCLDFSFTKIDAESDHYLQSIPYLQFPILSAGRPITGQRVDVPGVKYQEDWWTRRFREIRAYYRAHPNGPFVYSNWDSVPPRPETRSMHAAWLAQYKPLVEEGTWAWLEVGASDLFAGPLPKGVVASAFANRRMYLVLANYNPTAHDVETTGAYAAVAQPSSEARRRWHLNPRSLVILRRAAFA
jgi:hypothetical protein